MGKEIENGKSYVILSPGPWLDIATFQLNSKGAYNFQYKKIQIDSTADLLDTLDSEVKCINAEGILIDTILMEGEMMEFHMDKWKDRPSMYMVRFSRDRYGSRIKCNDDEGVMRGMMRYFVSHVLRSGSTDGGSDQ